MFKTNKVEQFGLTKCKFSYTKCNETLKKLKGFCPIMLFLSFLILGNISGTMIANCYINSPAKISEEDTEAVVFI